MFALGLTRLASCHVCLPRPWVSPSVRWLFGTALCPIASARSLNTLWSMLALLCRSFRLRFRMMARPWLTPMLSLALCRPMELPATTWLLPLAMLQPARLFAGAPTSGAVVPSAHCCRRPSTLCSRSRRRWSRSSLWAITRCPPSRCAPSPSGRVQSGPCSRGQPRGH